MLDVSSIASPVPRTAARLALRPLPVAPPPPDQVAQTPAPQAPRLPLPTLPAHYDGPILLVTTAAVRPDPYNHPVGAANLLKRVADNRIPIVYLPSDDKACDLSPYPAGITVSPSDVAGCNGLKGYLQTLRSQYPAAQPYLLAANQGTDARLAEAPGVQAYLRNTDPYQTDMPRGFEGILTDEYYENFVDRLTQDLRNSRDASMACGGNPRVRGTHALLPVYPNPPALDKPNTAANLLRLSRGVAGATTDIFGMLAVNLQHKMRSTEDSLALARGPVEAMAARNPAMLGRVARDIMDSKAPALEKSRLLFGVLTCHGKDTGHVDAILSCLPNPRRVEGVLQGQEAWTWSCMRSAGQPKVGDWQDFDTYLDGLTGHPARPGNKVDVLIDGAESFEAQLEAIRNAKEFINLSTFSFSSDQFARHFLAELDAAANRGVRINIIKDPMGSAKTYQTLMTDPDLLGHLRQYSNVQYIETPPSRLYEHLNHRKVMTMDNGRGDGGQVGFIGGMNIGNDYRIRWHDVHSRMEGPVLEDLNRTFIDQIRSFGGHVDAETEARMRHAQGPLPDGYAARIVEHVGLQDHNMKHAYLRAIETAAHSIDIADPYLSDPEVLDALEQRARDGVKVRLFVPQRNDQKYLKWAIQARYPRLLDAGVEIYEYKGREMAHEKVGVFDNRCTTIGSSNLDARSLSNNDEANLWSTDERLAQEVTRRLFDADVAHSHRVTRYDATTWQNALNEAATWAEPFL